MEVNKFTIREDESLDAGWVNRNCPGVWGLLSCGNPAHRPPQWPPGERHTSMPSRAVDQHRSPQSPQQSLAEKRTSTSLVQPARSLYPRITTRDDGSSHEKRPAPRNPLVKIQPPAHFRNVAQWLCRLPSEILLYYPILEGIPLNSILLLSGSVTDSDKLDRCIASRKEYKRVFPSVEVLANVRNAYSFLYELLVIKGFATTTASSSPLSCTAGELADQKPGNIRAVQNCLGEAIRRILTHREDDYYRFPWQTVHQRRLDLREYLKAQYQQDWNSPNSDAIKLSGSRFRNAAAQVNNMNTHSYFQHMEKPIVVLRHEQLSHMADLVEKYPEILRRASDPHSEPRPNWKHTVKYLRGLASEINKDIRKRYTWTPYQKEDVGSSWFRSDVFPIVPSDKSLAFFVAGVTKLLPVLPAWLAGIVSPSTHGNPSQCVSHTSNSQRLFATPFAKLCVQVDEGLYPYNVLKDIKTAVEDMAYIHVSPEDDTGYVPRVLRTKWTPWSAELYRQPSGHEAFPLEQIPMFMSPPFPHLDVLSPEKHERQCIQFYMYSNPRELHSLREFEWLHAFCRTVRFLEKMEHGTNPGYDHALEWQRQIDLRLRNEREWRRYQKHKGEGSDSNQPIS